MELRLDRAWKSFVSGNKSAFGEVYQILHPRLTLFCLGLIKELEEAENIASDSLLKLYENDDAASIRNAQSWVYTVARNSCNTRYTQESRRAEILESIHGYFRRTERNQGEVKLEREALREALKSVLSTEDLTIWDLHQAGYGNEEIAGKTGMNAKTVANRKSIARKKLMKRFNNAG